MAGDAGLTADEGLYYAWLNSVLPLVMYAGSTLPPAQAAAYRQQLINQILVKVWGGAPGEPLGPGGTYRPIDDAAIPWLVSFITAQVLRAGAPTRRT